VVIGKGEGHNWWCVMFPPLCYVDVTTGTVPDDSKQELKSVAKTDYILLLDQDRQEHVTVNVKFKIVEWWQNVFHKEQETKQKIDGYVVKDNSGAPDGEKAAGSDNTINNKPADDAINDNTANNIINNEPADGTAIDGQTSSAVKDGQASMAVRDGQTSMAAKDGQAGSETKDNPVQADEKTNQ